LGVTWRHLEFLGCYEDWHEELGIQGLEELVDWCKFDFLDDKRGKILLGVRKGDLP